MMNRDKFVEKWTPFAADWQTQFAMQLDEVLASVCADERANAAAICEARWVEYNAKFNESGDLVMKQVYFVKRVTARILREQIRSGQRAPVDGVADEKAEALPKGTPCVICGCDGSDPSHNSCAECVCWSVGDGQGFGISPNRATPDPAAAVTADDESDYWCLTEVDTPSYGEEVEVALSSTGKPFKAQWMNGAWYQDGHRRHPAYYPCWRRITPTAPPVANEWVNSTAELPEVNRYVSVREDESLEPYREPRFWNDGWWLVPENGSAPVLMYKDADCYAQWRYIVEPSASDTVEGDSETNPALDIIRKALNAALGYHNQVKQVSATDYNTIVIGLRLALSEHVNLTRKVANQAKELHRLNSLRAGVRTQRNGYWYTIYEQLAKSNVKTETALAEAITDRREARTANKKLAATCAEYERTVTGLRVELEETKLAVEDLVNTLREVANITGDWAAPERE